MIDFIRNYQLNLMLLVCGACMAMTIMLAMTRFLTSSRKTILIVMELVAFFLLWFDRYAYIYSGDLTQMGYIMVRVSNFAVFFLTTGMILGFNYYLSDLLTHEGGLKEPPMGLKIVQILSIITMVLNISNIHFNFFYSIDMNNKYHRENGFFILTVLSIALPLIQYIVVLIYRKHFSKIIFISLNLYLLVPVICAIIQVKVYGISLINISLAMVSLFLYLFTYLDINERLQERHKLEVEDLHAGKESMERLFSQTAMAFVKAIEKKDIYNEGHSAKVANYAKRLAEMAGKSEEICEEAFYAGLLHDVGLLGIPDSVANKIGNYTEEEYSIIKQKPVIGGEILKNITEYPYLSEGVHYTHEHYDGTGYPAGLKGEEIPEIARIVTVADAYVTMSSRRRDREAIPAFAVREALIKNAGTQFDPDYASLMVKIIDHDSKEQIDDESNVVETTIVSEGYKTGVTKGIPIDNKEIKITFDYSIANENKEGFSSPSLVIFDSYDKRVHSDAKAIKAYGYVEYAESWFDSPTVLTTAREDREISYPDIKSESEEKYIVTAGRYENHIRIMLTSYNGSKEVIIALSGGYNNICLALTGENCRLDNITVTNTEKVLKEGDIETIAPVMLFTDRMESDIPNIQIERKRSAYTSGIAVGRRTGIKFHTQTLPDANLVWNCPYIILYSSEDGKVNGKDYTEYAAIKLNGEIEENNENVINKFSVKKKETFKDWDYWKTVNKQGLECEVTVERKAGKIIIFTENLGIAISNTTETDDDKKRIYVALSGDVCALTDIRLK